MAFAFIGGILAILLSIPAKYIVRGYIVDHQNDAFNT